MATSANPPAGRIVHRTPGRVRVKFDKRTITSERLLQIQQALSEVKGIGRCEINPTTASLLVHHDDAELDTARLADAVGAIAPDPAGEQPDPDHERHPHSRLARTIDTGFGALDRRVRRLTGHHLDLKMILPIGFGALAVRQVIVNFGSLPSIPWYVLLWYTLDSYLRLHRTPQGQAAKTLMEAASQAGPGGD